MTVDISAAQRTTGGHCEGETALGQIGTLRGWGPGGRTAGGENVYLYLSALHWIGKLRHSRSHFLSPICMLPSLQAFLSPYISVHLNKNMLNADYVPNTVLDSGDT